MSIFQNNSPSQVCIWKGEGRKSPAVQSSFIKAGPLLEEPSMDGDESSACRSLGQLLGEVFVKRINLEAQKWAE